MKTAAYHVLTPNYKNQREHHEKGMKSRADQTERRDKPDHLAIRVGGLCVGLMVRTPIAMLGSILGLPNACVF